MSEVCTFTVVLPHWFLWAAVGALYLFAALAVTQAILSYKLKRLKLHKDIGQ